MIHPSQSAAAQQPATEYGTAAISALDIARHIATTGAIIMRDFEVIKSDLLSALADTQQLLAKNVVDNTGEFVRSVGKVKGLYGEFKYWLDQPAPTPRGQFFHNLAKVGSPLPAPTADDPIDRFLKEHDDD
jgi:hypothetical protein